MAAIKQLQPHNGGDWLVLLRELSNPDKHRNLLAIVSSVAVTFSANGEPVPPTFFSVFQSAQGLARLQREGTVPRQKERRAAGAGSASTPSRKRTWR